MNYVEDTTLKTLMVSNLLVRDYLKEETGSFHCYLEAGQSSVVTNGTLQELSHFTACEGPI